MSKPLTLAQVQEVRPQYMVTYFYDQGVSIFYFGNFFDAAMFAAPLKGAMITALTEGN